MKNASVSGSSKSQMILSSLPLPASFFKVLPLPQKFNRFHRFSFRFHIPGFTDFSYDYLHEILLSLRAGLG